MIDDFTMHQCRTDKDIRELKIKNLEYAIHQTEAMIAESSMDFESLTFLRRKLSDSINDLELLYLIDN